MVLHPPSTTVAERALVQLEERLSRLRTGQFFSFEAVEKDIPTLQEKIHRGKEALRMFNLGFPLLDPSFLGWMKKDTGMPAFMVLRLNGSNEFSIRVLPTLARIDNIQTIIWTIKPDLPDVFLEQYEEVILHLAKISRDRFRMEEIVITAENRGCMPEKARNKIRWVLENGYFEENEIFIIFEAPPWKIMGTGRTALGDPLAVGVKGDQVYLINAFLLSSLEQYVLTQHTI
jgi:hypothetical protein